MSIRSVAVTLVFAAWLAPAGANAQVKERAAAREALGAYNKGDYETALKKFQEAEAGEASLQSSERILIHKYIAYCQVAFGKREEAKAEFKMALALDPNIALDPSLVSPKIMEVFTEAKSAGAVAVSTPAPTPVATATPRATAGATATPTAVAFATPRPTPVGTVRPPPEGGGRGKAAIFSAIAPGLGQFKNGRPVSGSIFAGGAAVSLIAAALLHSEAATATSYIDKAGPDQRAQMYSQAKSLSSQRDIALLSLVAFWGGSVADAFLRTPKGPGHASIAPTLDAAGKPGVAVVIEF